MTTPTGAQLTADGVVGNTFPRLERVREQMLSGQDMGLWGEVVKMLDGLSARIDEAFTAIADGGEGIDVNSDRITTMQEGLADTAARVEELAAIIAAITP